MDLQTALEQSCNTFFFQLGSKMYDLPNQGIAFQKTIRQYGFGKTPPMDLPVSPYFSGLVPDPAWRLQTYSKPIDQVWQPGYDIQMAIGQGDLTVSPMQLAVAYSAHRQRRQAGHAAHRQGAAGQPGQRGQAVRPGPAAQPAPVAGAALRDPPGPV